MLKKPELPLKAKLLFAAAAVYLISPIDLIPDILLLVGWVDDGVVGVVMGMLSIWLFVRGRRAQRALVRPNVAR